MHQPWWYISPTLDVPSLLTTTTMTTTTMTVSDVEKACVDLPNEGKAETFEPGTSTGNGSVHAPPSFQQHEEVIVHWDSVGDPENPQNWSRSYRCAPIITHYPLSLFVKSSILTLM